MTDRAKLSNTRALLKRIEEDRADYELASEILARNEPTIPLEEVVRNLGLDLRGKKKRRGRKNK